MSDPALVTAPSRKTRRPRIPMRCRICDVEAVNGLCNVHRHEARRVAKSKLDPVTRRMRSWGVPDIGTYRETLA